ncbi:hypothetical protein H2200_007695 [Cladophialophora chaetospira]|uniref:Uncharacterized protein n=1 Tax=Cladophialophora chaetospira TaxID=386627 RepID=A0AA39CGQ2_9EURO|nr:hypothetical protein H2200_007695 [Cladophialophora chaetospira]
MPPQRPKEVARSKRFKMCKRFHIDYTKDANVNGIYDFHLPAWNPAIQSLMSNEVIETRPALIYSENDSQCRRLPQPDDDAARLASSSTIGNAVLDAPPRFYDGFGNQHDDLAQGFWASKSTMPKHLCYSDADQDALWLGQSAPGFTDELDRISSGTIDSFYLRSDPTPDLWEWVQGQSEIRQSVIALQYAGLRSLNTSLAINTSSMIQSVATSECSSSLTWSPQGDLFEWQSVASLSGSLGFDGSVSGAPDVPFNHDTGSWDLELQDTASPRWVER